jgi:hypothetical protein
MSEEPIEQFKEWRITGQPAPFHGQPFPPYNVIISKDSPAFVLTGRDPETVVREFMEKRSEGIPWDDGPHLHSRWITKTKWKEEE